MDILKTVILFLTNQATEFCSSGIACFIFLVVTCGYPLNGSVRTIGGELNSIMLHLCKLCQDVFFYFKA